MPGSCAGWPASHYEDAFPVDVEPTGERTAEQRARVEADHLKRLAHTWAAGASTLDYQELEELKESLIE
jgi:HPt (histidine-containing phosphotransfer) domain-containing protein